MISLLLSILCSSSIALILKLNSEKKGNPLLLVSGNYLVASLISGILIIFSDNFEYSLFTIVFGSFLGAIFLTSFFIFAKAVEAAGTPLATVSSRISVIVPVISSIIIFNEYPNTFQISGILLAFLTIILFYFSLKTNKTKKLNPKEYYYLLSLLIGIGVADFCMKIFQTTRPETEKSFFLFMIFSSAFVYSLLIIKYKNIKFDKKSFLRGGILGVPNIFSSYFLLGALSVIPAIVTYPSINIGIILFTTITAGIIWKEKINLFGKLALLAGIISIIFMSL